MAIEFDPAKDAANLAKHGVSLTMAEQMDMRSALIVVDDRQDYGETRYLAFGPIDEVILCLVFTVRGHNVRAISLRKANAKELKRIKG